MIFNKFLKSYHTRAKEATEILFPGRSHANCASVPISNGPVSTLPEPVNRKQAGNPPLNRGCEKEAFDMNDKVFVRVVENGARAMEEIDALYRQGYAPEDIYVLAHDKNDTDYLAGAADVNTISVKEEGMLQSIANWFRSRGDELRAKLESMGCTPREAQAYEAEMDRGRIIVMARVRAASRID
jgi:hypothetical protein